MEKNNNQVKKIKGNSHGNLLALDKFNNLYQVQYVKNG
jgi:hypothetical protein